MPCVPPGSDPCLPSQVHLPSLTAFSNFRVAAKKLLYRASCLDFSPHSGFFSVANNRGRAVLYRSVHGELGRRVTFPHHLMVCVCVCPGCCITRTSEEPPPPVNVQTVAISKETFS